MSEVECGHAHHPHQQVLDVAQAAGTMGSFPAGMFRIRFQVYWLCMHIGSGA